VREAHYRVFSSRYEGPTAGMWLGHLKNNSETSMAGQQERAREGGGEAVNEVSETSSDQFRGRWEALEGFDRE
jgi:hypothetical protein